MGRAHFSEQWRDAPITRVERRDSPERSSIHVGNERRYLLDRSAVEAAQPAQVVRKHGDASVTVYYPHIWLGPSLTLWCGSVPIGKARKGQKMNFTLPPGEYHFRLWQTGDQYLLHAEDGAEYYMQIVVPSFRAN